MQSYIYFCIILNHDWSCVWKYAWVCICAWAGSSAEAVRANTGRGTARATGRWDGTLALHLAIITATWEIYKYLIFSKVKDITLSLKNTFFFWEGCWKQRSATDCHSKGRHKPLARGADFKLRNLQLLSHQTCKCTNKAQCQIARSKNMKCGKAQWELIWPLQ